MLKPTIRWKGSLLSPLFSLSPLVLRFHDHLAKDLPPHPTIPRLIQRMQMNSQNFVQIKREFRERKAHDHDFPSPFRFKTWVPPKIPKEFETVKSSYFLVLCYS